MSLLGLPFELLLSVLRRLPGSSLAQLCLTSREAYETCVPLLYGHLRLSYRHHVRQLAIGMQHRPLLRKTIELYTQKVTLRPKQSGNHWLVADFCRLFPELKQVREVVCSHFGFLSVDRVRELAGSLPQLTHVTLNHCRLVATQHRGEIRETEWGSTDTSGIDDEQEQEVIAPTPKSEEIFERVCHLNAQWTDFSVGAATQLLSSMPLLGWIDLGANHNRIPTANDGVVASLWEHCPRLRHMSISLQQVSESTLCELISKFGGQLETLAIRCDGLETLGALATYCTRLERLVIRAANTPWTVEFTTTPPDEEITNTVVSILQHCQGLVQLEMVSWVMQDVPVIVWRAMDTVIERQGPCQPLSLSIALQPHKTCLKPKPSTEDPIQGYPHGTIRKTLRLEQEVLQEIRKEIHSLVLTS
ncbi:hypothetical protein J3Q64DRAFT_1763327 [Phycomyces blakesleeanus]|uniref:F-box domain-containing protein n=2 Tax=Phycomyces blakesleeanus TaxID=4837 RepID=A0A162TGZ2_PHYB8|nr:hypothetical protein PHYBLDRAFT_150685 [Phycomyces blakesleeanus NRRL 1555(-)]OAD68512.1 hypothetical protein PHYBLDRAFT_150685 [Phycomyces blakesleeanus NRRL 1555(-)]|eukprot:XP_018286552.1 hypothetical protein PHYBLDRAFT_150685 [Phycomyces blakesleeanus NRRL 1555(-)]